MPAAAEAGVFALMGRIEEARTALRRVVAAGRETIGPAGMWLPSRAILTQAITAVGDADLASGVYKALLPYARLNVSSGGAATGGSVARYPGMLSATRQPWGEAGGDFQRALH